MKVVVEELVNESRLKGIHVITNSLNLQRAISTVTVLDAPDGPSWLKGEELVLTSGYIFKEEKELSEFIRYLIDAKACGLGIKLNRYHNHISEEIINLANEHSFSIFIIPYHYVWSDVISIYYELKESEEKTIHQISSKDIYALYVASKWGTIRFAQKLVELINCETIVFNHRNDVMYENSKSQDHFFEEELTPSLVNHFKTNYIEKIETDYYLFKKGFEDTKQLFFIIRSNDKFLLENILEVVVMLGRFQKKDRFENITDEIYGFFLNQLADQMLTLEEIHQFEKDQGINDSLHTAVAIIENERYYDVYKEIREEARLLIPKGAITFHSYLQTNGKHGSLLVLIELQKESLFSIIDLYYLIQKVSQKYAKKTNDCVVISEFYARLTMIQTCYTQALETLKIGGLIYKNRSFISYDKIAPFAFVNQDQLSAINFFEINRLLEDKEKNSYDSVETLEVYLEEKNYKKAAERLFLHENTLRYRIQKIASTLKIDLEDNFYSATLLNKIKLWKLI